jgi:hypothetical protein
VRQFDSLTVIQVSCRVRLTSLLPHVLATSQLPRVKPRVNDYQADNFLECVDLSTLWPSMQEASGHDRSTLCEEWLHFPCRRPLLCRSHTMLVSLVRFITFCSD